MSYRALSLFLIAALFIAEAMFLSGLIPAPHNRLFGSISSQGVAPIFSVTFNFAFLLFCSRQRLRTALILLAAGAGLVFFYIVFFAPEISNWRLCFYIWLGLTGILAIFSFFWQSKWAAEQKDRELNRALLLASGIFILYALCAESYLSLGAVLQPMTLDPITYAFDASLGFQASELVSKALISLGDPHLTIWLSIYAFISTALVSMYGLQRSATAPQPYNVVKFLIVSGTLALFGYYLFPVAGPLYLFTTQFFPGNLPPWQEIGVLPILLKPAARNGMPSMHFGWALALWLMARYQTKLVRGLYLLMLVLTIIATLGLGEHYLIDLIVAIPFVLGLLAICADVLPWANKVRRQALLVGFGLYLVWLLALRFGISLFLEVPGLSWIAILLTTAIGVYFIYRLQNNCAAAIKDGTTAIPEAKPIIPPQFAYERRYVGMLFFLSGAAALIYQVLFTKQLSYVFGSQAVATYTVLATYMGGMAIGAWLGGRIAANLSRPILIYAVCELAIGVYCLVSPVIFTSLQSVYSSLGTDILAQPTPLLLLRLGLGALGLIVPTTLMGMTLPILARHFERRAETLGHSVSLLYGANTIGAGIGALLAGYFIIPLLGVSSTTLLTVALNLAVAVLAIELHKKAGAVEVLSPAGQAAIAPASAGSLRRGLAAMVVLLLGGYVTLSIEVNYVHLLAVVAGNSTYAFSLMLFAFLMGLGGGAEFARWLLARRFPRAQVLFSLELSLALAILVSAFVWDGIPRHFASYEKFPVALGFGAREVIRGMVCLVAMFPTAFFIGAIFPVAIEEVGAAFPQRQIRMLGWASALNTFGNILGVLVTGFIFLPAIGALHSNQTLALICVLLAIFVIVVAREIHWPRHAAGLAVVAIIALLQPASLDYEQLTTGANVYFKKQEYGKVISHAESLDGGLTTTNEQTLSDGRTVRTLLTNGKFQGNNHLTGEMQAQAGFALAPLAHTSARDSALLIGFGTGTTARALQAGGFKHLDIADLSADIYAMSNRYFREVNDGVLDQPGVAAHVIDGRNYLMLADRHYDTISIEVTSIWFAGASSLYNKEFYQLAKRRLNKGGVLQQWMQIHHSTPLDLLYILSTIRSEFKYVWVYLLGGQGVVVASNDPSSNPMPQRLLDMEKTAGLQPFLKLFPHGAQGIADGLLIDPAGIDKMVASTGLPQEMFISTDNNLFLEYSTPQGNALDNAWPQQTNLAFLAQFAVARPKK